MQCRCSTATAVIFQSFTEQNLLFFAAFAGSYIGNSLSIRELRPHSLMDWADFWYGGSFLVELPLKVAIFEEFKNEFIFPLGYPQTPTRASPGELWGEGGMIPIHNKR